MRNQVPLLQMSKNTMPVRFDNNRVCHESTVHFAAAVPCSLPKESVGNCRAGWNLKVRDLADAKRVGVERRIGI